MSVATLGEGLGVRLDCSACCEPVVGDVSDLLGWPTGLRIAPDLFMVGAVLLGGLDLVEIIHEYIETNDVLYLRWLELAEGHSRAAGCLYTPGYLHEKPNLVVNKENNDSHFSGSSPLIRLSNGIVHQTKISN